jgi:hypothetical protein
MNNAATIRLPTRIISDSDINASEIEKPNRRKKNVLIKNEVSAVTECSKWRKDTTCSCGK